MEEGSLRSQAGSPLPQHSTGHTSLAPQAIALPGNRQQLKQDLRHQEDRAPFRSQTMILLRMGKSR